MEISFTVFRDIQIVTIKGKLGEAEAAAVRNKLEEKLNKGRAKVLFDLAQYPIEDDTSRKLILNVINYSLNRGALTSCCGVPVSKWPLFQTGGARKLSLFLVKDEAKDAMAKADAPTLDKLGSVVPPLQQEDEIKDRALKELLAKYEIFQNRDEDDPFRLEFYAEQYKIQPNAEAVVAEKKAQEALADSKNLIKILDTECEALAARIKSAILYRKNPISERELGLKETTLKKQVNEQKALIDEVTQSLRGLKQKEEKLRKEMTEEKARLDAEFTDLQKRYHEVCVEVEADVKHVMEVEIQELREFDEKKTELLIKLGITPSEPT